MNPGTPKAHRQGKRRLLVVGGLLTGGLLVLAAAGLVLLLQTDPGRHWIAGRLAAMASGPGSTVTIGALQGRLPFAISLIDVTVADHKGRWLTARRTDIAIDGRALLAGRLDVVDLTVDRLEIVRPPLPLPEPAGATAEPASGAGIPVGPDTAHPETPALPAPTAAAAAGKVVPALPLPVTVRRLVVDEVALGTGLLGGAPTLLHAEGDARLGEHLGPQRLDLDLSHRDGQPGGGHLHVDYAPDTDRLNLDLAIVEPPGGVLARALRLRDLPAVDFKATGSAPLADWHGSVSAHAGQRAALAGEAAIRRGPGGYRITLQGGGDVTALLPRPWATLIGPALRLALDLLADDDGGLTLRPESSLAFAAAAVTAGGRLDPDTNRLTLDYRLTPVAGALIAAGALPAGSHWRDAVLSGTIEGSPTAPALTAALRVEEPASPNLTAHSVAATLTSTPATGGIRNLTLDAAVDYLSGADSTMTRLAGPHAQLTMTAATRQGSEVMRLSKVALTVAAGRITATGNAEPGTGRLQATGHFAIDHLSRLLGPFGLPLSGVADLDLSLKAGRDGTQLDVTGSAGTLQTDIDTVDRTLAALLDNGLRVKGTVTVDGRGGFHARDWHLDGHQLAVSGQADLADRRLDATVQLDLPQLAPLADPLGLPPLTGGASLNASWHGPLTAAEARARLVVTDLGVSGRALGQSELNLTATGLPANPRVQLGLRAAAGLATLKPVIATATLALSPDGKALLMDSLSANQGDNRINGTLRLAFNAGDATGHLAGQLPDLAALAPFAGVPLAGRGRFDAVLGRRADHATLLFAGGTNALRLGGSPAAPALGASDLEFKGSVTAASFIDLAAGRITGSVALNGQSLKSGPVAVGVLNATLEGSPSEATFRVVAPTGPGQPDAVDLAGSLDSTPDHLDVRLTRLAGRFGDVPMSLARPAVLTIGPAQLAVSGLRLTGQDFHLDADGAIGADGLSGRLTIGHLPLALLHLVQPVWPGHGHLDADATLSGSLADPRAEIAAQVKDATLTQAEIADLDLGTLDGTLQAHWRSGRLAADGAIQARDGASLHWTGEVPLALRLSPLAIAMPDGAALHATASGTLPLATFGDLLADRGDRLTGTLTAALSLGGTIAAPDLGGTLTVDNGRYENQALGSVIDRISARISGTGGAFTIEHLSGHTADDGEVAATGQLKFGTPNGEAFDVHLTARDARLVQLDPITANVDADLTLTGEIKAPRLAGSVMIRHADIRLPDRLPSEVVDLQVTEGRAPPGTPAGPAPASTAASSAAPAPGRGRRPVLPGSVVRVTAPPATAAAPVGPPTGPTLALTVSARSNVFVHGRGVDSEFAGDLKITGALPAPLIKGTLTMLHGRLDLLGKEFQFKHGTIDFAGGSDLDPDLDLLAEARTGSITAEAGVTGRVRAPLLTLTSVPVMPQDEILARLLFDKPVSQLGALEAVQLADSAAQLSGLGGSSALVERVRRSLGIDRLNVTSTAPGAKRETVEAGRYVAQDVYLGVQQGPGEDSSRAKVEIAITRTLQAEVDVGVHADPQVGLKFEWDY